MSFSRSLAAALALCALGIATAALGSPSHPRPRNVILISLDTLRADRVGAYGHPGGLTPTLDALAARGTRFADASSTSAWTSPAHASLFTGLYPSRLGLVAYRGLESAEVLGEAHTTLAEVLRARGWQTRALTGGNFVAARLGFGQGFEAYDDWAWRFGEHEKGLQEFLAGRDRSRPFLLFLHGYDAHHPYEAEPDLARHHYGEYGGSYDVARFCREDPPASGPDLGYVKARYDAAVATADRSLGRLLAMLDADGALAESLVIAVSDHGEEFYEHGGCDHVDRMYQEVVQVPLLIAGPGVPAGRVVRAPVSLVDVMPTVLDALGLSRLPGDGRSLWPDLGGRRAAERTLLVESGREDAVMRAVRRLALKLHVDATGRPGPLFDLSRDPGEREDLAGSRPALVQRLLAEVAGRAVAPAERIPLDPELRERLKALGYIQ